MLDNLFENLRIFECCCQHQIMIQTLDSDLRKPVTLREYTVVLDVGDSSVNDSDV
jgi:hypothetical protein